MASKDPLKLLENENVDDGMIATQDVNGQVEVHKTSDHGKEISEPEKPDTKLRTAGKKEWSTGLSDQKCQNSKEPAAENKEKWDEYLNNGPDGKVNISKQNYRELIS